MSGEAHRFFSFYFLVIFCEWIESKILEFEVFMPLADFFG